MTGAWLRPLLIAASILSYLILAHISNAARWPLLGAALASAPLLLALTVLVRRLSHSWLAAAAAAAAAMLLLWRDWRVVEQHYSVLYLLQDCGLYLLLAIGFGRSLLPGHEPLCTVWAERSRGQLNDSGRAYTRAVTLAWTVFFSAIILLSIALYVSAPLRVWSAFSYFLTLPLVALMFVGEYALRHRLNPELARVSLLHSVRAYLVYARNGATPRS